MNRALWIWVILLGTAAPALLAGQRSSAQASKLRVIVETPDTAGVKVRLTFLDGPDSLKGKRQEIMAPDTLVVEASTLTLVVERAEGPGAIWLRVERLGGNQGMDEGGGNRLRLQAWPDSVKVRVLPSWMPL